MIRRVLILSLAAALLHPATAQDAPSTPPAEATETSGEMLPWQKTFSNLPKEKRDEFSGHLAKARELFGKKRVFEAIDELHKAQLVFPDSPDVENLLGACQVEFRSFDKALEHFNRASELSPGALNVEFNIAEVEFVKKDWAKAEPAFAALLKKAEEQADGDKARQSFGLRRVVEFKLMICRMKLGQMDEARKMAAKYDHLDDSPFVYYAAAVLAYHDGDDKTAESEIQTAARVFRSPTALAAWQDTMVEAGYIKSIFGEALSEEGE